MSDLLDLYLALAYTTNIFDYIECNIPLYLSSVSSQIAKTKDNKSSDWRSRFYENRIK